MPFIVDLAQGIVYDLTNNMDTTYGIINGATCIAMRIALPVGNTLPSGIVWVVL